VGIHSEAQLNRKFMEFAVLLNIYLSHFPKYEKFALANRIRNTAYKEAPNAQDFIVPKNYRRVYYTLP